MSMQQALGAVGFVVGSYFGYPQLGFVVGSLAGAALTPATKVEGPRLDDLKVQVSTYGAGIPKGSGTERYNGNVFFCTDKREIATTEEQGKGGGQETTTFHYVVDMAIGLMETPRNGDTVSMRKMYVDGKLTYDASTGVSIGSALASAVGISQGGTAGTGYILYQGAADQLPDPTMEMWKGGPGSVPAYRGIVYIMLTGVECPGGRVPQFSFELATFAGLGPEKIPMADFTSGWSGFASADGVYGFDTDPAGFVLSVRYAADGSDGELITKYSLGSTYITGDKPYAVTGAPGPMLAQSWGVLKYGLGFQQVRVIDMLSGRISVLFEEPTSASPSIGAGARSQVAFDSVSGRYAVTQSSTTQRIRVVSSGFTVEMNTTGLDPQSPIDFHDSVVYGLNQVAGAVYFVLINGEDGTSIGVLNGPTVPDVQIGRSLIQADSTGAYVLISSDLVPARIYRVEIDRAGLSSTWRLLCNDADPEIQTVNVESKWVCTETSAIVGPSTTGVWNLIRFEAVDPDPILVKDEIAKICEEAGEARYDVTGIPDSDVVWGYKRTNPASARANVDPLLTAFGIYIVDEDGLIKFKKFDDIASVATIGFDELGQSEDGSDPNDAMPLNRAQEVDLPRSVTVNYIEKDFDYQTASERESRQVTDATEDMQVDVPLALNNGADEAKKIATQVLYQRHRSQNTRSTKVSRKYAFLSPGDGVTIEYPRATFRLWRIMSSTDTGTLIELNLEPGDAQLYTQSAVGASGYTGQAVAPLASPQRLELGDMSILQDADNNAGLYAFMEPMSGGDPGAELYVGDDDTNLQSRGTVGNAAVIGFVEGVLGSWSMNIMDETNTMVVNIGADELFSTTRPLIDTTNVNACAVGINGRWEILKFLRATSLGSGRYLLSGLVRGLRGTERNRGTHAANDRFILLSLAGALRPNMEVGQIGQEKRYRAISKGRSLDSAPSQVYANTGEGLKPFGPWDFRWSKAANNDITLSWGRRTRLSSNAFMGILPLGESAEAYSIDFFSSSALTTFVGIFSSFTTSLTVTSAQQTAMGLTPGNPPHVRVYMLSDSVGRGAPLEASN